MSEALIPGYYNTKINNHDWHIYMGGERYFPAYPTKRKEYVPVKDVVKRYLVLDSSTNGDYTNQNINTYPLTLKEAFINENDESMEFDGNTYYLWRAYQQRYDDSIEDAYSAYGQLILLTTTLTPSLPFTMDNEEYSYIITLNTESNQTEYLSHNYKFIGYAEEYSDGTSNYNIANCKARLYNYEHSSWLVGEKGVDNPMDYFQYDGEIVEYEGQRCYVWNRYDSDRLCLEEGFDRQYKLQKILTNTLWINSLPFTMDSPEFVTWINYDILYPDGPMDMPFDRIEYLPDTVYGQTITGMTEQTVDVQENIGVKTYLYDDYDSNPDNPINEHYVYNGKTMTWEGKLCYVWEKTDLGYRDEWPYYVLTNTLNVTLPLDENADYFETAFDYKDENARYNGQILGRCVRKPSHIVRTKEYIGPPCYITKKGIVIK